MNLLLDTHTFLWFINGDSKLSQRARVLIEDMANERWLSMASLWEMGIKFSMGKLKFSAPYETYIPQHLQQNAVKILNFKMEHMKAISKLPFSTSHKDPFDRLIIVQSLSEQFPVLSADSHFDDYLVQRLW
jgi:PIN domain nuclease of toxin-antitoxin system